MTNSEQKEEGGEIPEPNAPQPSPHLDATHVFTEGFLLLLAHNPNRAVGPLVDALRLLADMRLLTVFCPHAERVVHTQADGTQSFHTEVTHVTQNGNVQLNCE